MSKKRKREGDQDGANRNLDGRRLRTVREAKALAEYLATKPDMDKKEKEARRARLEEIVDVAERREAEIKSGSRGKVDGKWVEDKEEAGERTRDAVKAAMLSGLYKDNFSGTPDDSAKNASTGSESEEDEDDEEVGQSSSAATTPPLEKGQAQKLSFFGFDDEDAEFLSDDDEEEEDEKEEPKQESIHQEVYDQDITKDLVRDDDIVAHHDNDEDTSPVPEIPVSKKGKTAAKGKAKAKPEASNTRTRTRSTRTK